MAAVAPRRATRRARREVRTRPIAPQTAAQTGNDTTGSTRLYYPTENEQQDLRKVGRADAVDLDSGTAGKEEAEQQDGGGKLSRHIKKAAIALLAKDTQLRQQANGQTQSTALIRSTFTLAIVLFAILVYHLARMSESQSNKAKVNKRSKSVAEAPSKAQFAEQPSLPLRTKPMKPEATPTSSQENIEMPDIPESSGTSSQHPQAQPPVQPQNDDMAKLLQMMAQSLQQLGNRPPVYSTQLPPYPSETVPVFDGTNVTTFLERFEDMSKYYEFTDKMKIDRLSAHCKPKQRAIIQASNEYSNALVTESWKEFREALRKLFRTNDKDQQEARAEYFEHWLLQCQARSNLNIKEYLQEFQIRSKRCVEASTIDEDRRGFYLVKGLPFRHAMKILDKFSLKTDNPKAFNYTKISDYLTTRLEVEEEARMLNPSEAVKEIVPEVEFNPAQPIARQQPQQPAPTPQDNYTQAFQPPKLNVPLRDEPLRLHASQSPPGKAPTNTEVDDLVNKMLDLKINRASLEMEPWKIQWTHRETELMNNSDIRSEVDRRANERANHLRAYPPQGQGQFQPNNQYRPQQQQQYGGYQQNTGQTFRNNSQGFQNPGTGYNQGTANGQALRATMNCWVCDKSDHRKQDCPTLRAYMDKGWLHMDERNMLQWGTPENPQGRINNLGQRLWAESISAEIKRRFLKEDIDPLTVNARFGNPKAPIGVENNAISVQLMPDSTGSLQADDVEQFWKLSSIFAEDESDYRPRLANLNQCNNTIAAATISRASSEPKKAASHDPSKVQKKTILRRPSDDHIPHLRGHKNRTEHPSSHRALNKERVVQFSEEDDLMQLDNGASGTPQGQSEPKPKTTDKQPRKRKIVDKLEPDAQAIIRSILGTSIPLQIGTLLGNMPEVRKTLFNSNYTNEELDKFEVNVIETLRQQARQEELQGEEEEWEFDEPSGAEVNAITLSTLPDYVLVEAEAGRVVDCYSLKAEHWTDQEISHVQQHIIADQGQEYDPEDADYDHLRDDRAYDRPMGIEHLRRDCPKVPIDIRGNSFLCLLDSGAELNTIKREAAERAMLPITSLPGSMKAARMVTANGSTASFVGIVWGVPVVIGQIEVRTNFFVVESCTNPIILGNPFLTDARARIEYATNGLTYCRIFSADGQANTRFVCARSNKLTAPGLYAGPTSGKGMGV